MDAHEVGKDKDVMVFEREGAVRHTIGVTPDPGGGGLGRCSLFLTATLGRPTPSEVKKVEERSPQVREGRWKPETAYSPIP